MRAVHADLCGWMRDVRYVRQGRCGGKPARVSYPGADTGRAALCSLVRIWIRCLTRARSTEFSGVVIGDEADRVAAGRNGSGSVSRWWDSPKKRACSSVSRSSGASRLIGRLGIGEKAIADAIRASASNPDELPPAVAREPSLGYSSSTSNRGRCSKVWACHRELSKRSSVRAASS